MSFFIKVPYNPLKALCTTPLLPTPAQPSSTFIVQHQFSSSYKQSSGFHNSSYNSHSGRDSFNCGLLKKNNTKNLTVVIVLTMGKVVLTTATGSNTISSKVIVPLHPIGGLIHSLF
jgi:hypothetical protein